MPNHADKSPNIAFPLPEVKSAFALYPVFDDEMFKRVKNIVKSLPMGPESGSFYHTSMGRWESGVFFDDDIEEYFLKLARDAYDDQSLVKAYHYSVRYQIQDGNIPYLHKHMDQNGCQQTIDICIESPGVTWAVEVDDVVFDEKENGAVCFYGQQQVHSRPMYPTDNPDAYVLLLFLHYVKPDHWFAKAFSEGGIDKVRQEFSKYGLDGDIRYFEHTGLVSQPELPENQKRCECHNYREVPKALKEKLNLK